MDSTTPLHRPMPYENPGSGVNIAIWMCFITAGLTVVSKILSKIPETHGMFKLDHYRLDDALCLCAIVRASGERLT
jgi:hypothetical protein